MPFSTDTVLAEDESNTPPAGWKQFAMARVRVKYLGVEPTYADSDLIFRALGVSGGGYEERCGRSWPVLPDQLDYERLLSANEEIEGNICLEVSQFDASSLVMSVTLLGLLPSGGGATWYRAWFALGSEPPDPPWDPEPIPTAEDEPTEGQCVDGVPVGRIEAVIKDYLTVPATLEIESALGVPAIRGVGDEWSGTYVTGWQKGWNVNFTSITPFGVEIPGNAAGGYEPGCNVWLTRIEEG